MYQPFCTNAEASATHGGPMEVELVWARLKADPGSGHIPDFDVWGIQLTSNNCYAGTWGFWQGTGWPGELTWWILPDAHAQGVATEASQATVAHAYQKFQWQTG